MKFDKMINQADILDIEKEIASIERVTSGEIVPAIVNRSSKYRTAEVVAAVILSYVFVFFAYEVNRYFFWDTTFDIFQFILLNFIGMLLAFLLFRIDAVKRLIISKKVMHQKVHDGAFATFYQQGVHKTKHNTGILIYISLFEREVVVLGDEGINAKVKESAWDDVVSKIIKGIKEEHLKKGIVDGIGSCRDLLKTHFPIQADDVNELSDRIVIKKN
jgi:putative membrane protein